MNNIILPPPTVEQMQATFDNLSANINGNKNLKVLIAIKSQRIELMNVLNPIVSQICDCLLIQANIAAITLTNHLLERTLKQAIIIKKSNGKTYSSEENINDVFKDEIENCDDKKMESTIDCAKTLNIITKDDAKRLKTLKDNYRNPYSHANNKEIFKDMTAPAYIGSLVNNREIEEQSAKISYTPIFQEHAIVELCKRSAFSYFSEVYGYIVQIEKVLKELYK